MRKSTRDEQKFSRMAVNSKRVKTEQSEGMDKPALTMNSSKSSLSPHPGFKSRSISSKILEKSLNGKIRHQKEMSFFKLRERLLTSRQSDKKVRYIMLIVQRTICDLKRFAWGKILASKRKYIAKNQACNLLSKCLKRVILGNKKSAIEKLHMMVSFKLKSKLKQAEISIAQSEANKFSGDFLQALNSLEKGRIKDKDIFIKNSAQKITPMLANQLSQLTRKRKTKNCVSDSEAVALSLKSHIQCLMQIYKQLNSTVQSSKQIVQKNNDLATKLEVHDNSLKDIKKLNKILMNQHEKMERILLQAKEAGFVGSLKSCKSQLSNLKRVIDQQTEVCLNKSEIDGAYELRNNMLALLNYYINKFQEGLDNKIPSSSTPKSKAPEVFHKVAGKIQQTIQTDQLNQIILNCRKIPKLKALKQKYFYEACLNKIIDNYIELNSQLAAAHHELKQEKNNSTAKSRTNLTKEKPAPISKNRTTADNTELPELYSIIQGITLQIEKHAPKRVMKNTKKAQNKSAVQELQHKVQQLFDTLHKMKLEKDAMQEKLEAFKKKQGLADQQRKNVAADRQETNSESLNNQIKKKQTEIIELRRSLAQEKNAVNRLQQKIQKLTNQLTSQPTTPNIPKPNNSKTKQSPTNQSSNALQQEYEQKLTQKDIQIEKLKNKVTKFFKHYESKSNKMTKFKEYFMEFNEKFMQDSQAMHLVSEQRYETENNFRINSFSQSLSAKNRYHSITSTLKSQESELIAKDLEATVNQKILNLMYNICKNANPSLNQQQQQDIYHDIRAICEENTGDDVYNHLESFIILHFDKVIQNRLVNNQGMISSRDMHDLNPQQRPHKIQNQIKIEQVIQHSTSQLTRNQQQKGLTKLR